MTPDPFSRYAGYLWLLGFWMLSIIYIALNSKGSNMFCEPHSVCHQVERCRGTYSAGSPIKSNSQFMSFEVFTALLMQMICHVHWQFITDISWLPVLSTFWVVEIE
jgi:hypothetical protein